MWRKMWKQVLVISAHSDDGEIGCGGTIARLIEEGATIYYPYFALPPTDNQEPSSLDETMKAFDVLGVHGFPAMQSSDYLNTRMGEHRQEILDRLVHIYKMLTPDLVFCPSSFDTHQDHKVVYEETFRACKRSTILGYDFYWNERDSRQDCYIPLEQGHIDKKVAAIQEHQSQLFRPFLPASAIIDLAKVRGTAIGVKYAEAFEVIRWIW